MQQEHSREEKGDKTTITQALFWVYFHYNNRYTNMKIVKIKESDTQKIEKIRISEPSVIFILSDPRHRPIVQVFQGV